MKVVIIGGGISGFTAYLALKKHLPRPAPPAEDHEYTIYEAYDTNKDTTFRDRVEGPVHSSTLIVGGGLGVGSNGLNVLKRLDEDLLRDIVRGGYTIGCSNLKSRNGSILVRIAASARSGSLKAEKDEPQMHMVASSRHSLWRCLRVRVPDSVIVNKRVAEVIANAEGRNVVHFTDGSPVEADLVIGADGLKSTVKKALFPEAKEDPYPPHYEGLVGIGGFIPVSEVKDYVEDGSMNFIFGGNGFFGYFYSDSALSEPNRDSPYHVSKPGDLLAWWSTYEIDECPDPKTIDMEDVTRQLCNRHAHWKDPVIQKIIQSVCVENMYPTWTSPQLPTWERDGVVLLGDAAHALPPTSGQGSSQALEDVETFVLFLSHYLREAYQHLLPSQIATEKQAIKTAAKQYMDLRKSRVKAILDHAKGMQDRKRDMNVFKEYMMYTVLWIFGLFPSFFEKPLRSVYEYNPAEQVERVLAANK